MPEIEIPVKIAAYDRICDSCNIGKMRPTPGTVAHPPYEHRCDYDPCGRWANYPDRYPTYRIIINP